MLESQIIIIKKCIQKEKNYRKSLQNDLKHQKHKKMKKKCKIKDFGLNTLVHNSNFLLKKLCFTVSRKKFIFLQIRNSTNNDISRAIVFDF